MPSHSLIKHSTLYRIALVLFVCILVLHGTHIRNRASVAVPGVDWLVLARLAACGFAFVIGIILIPKNVSWGFGAKAVILYVLAAWISIVNTPYPMLVGGYACLLLGVSTLTIALVYHARDIAQLEKIEKVWFFTVAIFVVKDAVTALVCTQASPFPGHSRLGMGVTHATELSLFSVLIFWMSFGMKSRRYRMILWPFRVFLIFVIIAAKSRIPILGFAMGGFCYFLLSTRDYLKRGVVISCAGCLVVFLLLALTLGQTWASGMSNYMKRGQDTKELTSFTGRTFIWRHVLKESRRSPLVGRGFSVSRLTMGDIRDADWEWEPPHCHNEMLEVFFNTGLFGLVPFIAMLLYSLTWILHSARLQSIFTRSLALHAMFLVVMLFVSAMFEVRLSGKISPVQPLFFFYLMMLDRRGYFRKLQRQLNKEDIPRVKGLARSKEQVFPAQILFNPS